MKIAITGSSGFIGTHLIQHVKTNNPQYEIIELDISNGIDLLSQSSLNKIPPFNVIIHLAGKSFVPDSFSNPHSFYYTNINSTLNVLELCRKYSARLIMFSSYVYGTPEYLPIDEKHPLKAFNPYAQSKIICEELCKGYNRDFNVPSLIFRPFNIYGDGQNKNFLIPLIIDRIKNGDKKIQLKDARPRRDFIHVSDVVNAICKGIESNFEFDILNLASGMSYSVEELTEIICSSAPKLGLSFDFDKSAIRPNEVLETVGSISNITQKLNWIPKVSLVQGIKQLLAPYI